MKNELSAINLDDNTSLVCSKMTEILNEEEENHFIFK